MAEAELNAAERTFLESAGYDLATVSEEDLSRTLGNLNLNDLKTTGADLGGVENPANLGEISERLATAREAGDNNLIEALERQEQILQKLQGFRRDMDSLTGAAETAGEIMNNKNFQNLSDLQTSSEWKEADDDGKLAMIRDNTREMKNTEKDLKNLKKELQGKSGKEE